MVSSTESTWRVFCAIEIPEEIRQRISHHGQQLHDALRDVQASWAKPDNIHLTLKFFGNITQQQVLKASEAAARSVEGFAPFTIKIEGAGAFPPRGPAKVLWIGISDPTGVLIQCCNRNLKVSVSERLSQRDQSFSSAPDCSAYKKSTWCEGACGQTQGDRISTD